MITIIDYGSGNIRAIANIYDDLKIEYSVSCDEQEISRATKLILPGVGAFDQAIRHLDGSGIRDALCDAVQERKVPVLGICVGMQIMAATSDEGDLPGLGWFDAKVTRFDASIRPDLPLPHMGWNSVRPRIIHSLFDGVDVSRGFYFLHSYHFECNDPSDILSQTDYGAEFTSAVARENVYGTQFHPEKSHGNGIRVLKNFATQVDAAL